MSAPLINGDVTVTVTASVAEALIARQHPLTHAKGRSRLPEGSRITNPQQALRAALVAIAENESATASPEGRRGEHRVRVSEQGERFGVILLRDFLQSALAHDVLADQVNDALFEAVHTGQDPATVASHLQHLIAETLQTAAFADWQQIASTLIKEAREALDIDDENNQTENPNTSEATPHKPTKSWLLRALHVCELRETLAEIHAHEQLTLRDRLLAKQITWLISLKTRVAPGLITAQAKADAEAIRDARRERADQTADSEPAGSDKIECPLKALDAGELREKLAEIYAHEPRSLKRAVRAHVITRRIGQQTGITHRQIRADAKADADAIRFDTNNQSTSKSTTAANVCDSLRQGFVRPLGRDEALTLIQKGEGSKFADTRKRAAIILASNVGVTAQELAAIHKISASQVLSVIADFNEQGVASVGDFPQ